MSCRKLGPHNEAERVIFAQEELRVSLQQQLYMILKNKGTRSGALASNPVFNNNWNPTLRELASTLDNG